MRTTARRLGGETSHIFLVGKELPQSSLSGDHDTTLHQSVDPEIDLLLREHEDSGMVLMKGAVNGLPRER